MSYERKNGDVVIFKNNRKEKDTQPDYTGSALLDDKEYSISLWVKEGKNGKFFAGREELKVERIEHNEATVDPDDLPF